MTLMFVELKLITFREQTHNLTSRAISSSVILLVYLIKLLVVIKQETRKYLEV